MKSTVSIISSVLLATLAVGAQAGGNDKHLVELFTSHGCSSCPPADRLLGELIGSRDDIVALEFHVDYWDDLVYGLAGSWKDPFSDPRYTQRQVRYEARGLAGNNGVYTPQAVVDGRTAVVGADERALVALLAGDPPNATAVRVKQHGAGLRVAVSGNPAGPAEVWLYRFDVRAVTQIEAGENKGMTLTNHHIVRTMRRLGVWREPGQEYVVEDLALTDGQSCAVVVQRPDQGPVLAAGLCPS